MVEARLRWSETRMRLIACKFRRRGLRFMHRWRRSFPSCFRNWSRLNNWGWHHHFTLGSILLNRRSSVWINKIRIERVRGRRSGFNWWMTHSWSRLLHLAILVLLLPKTLLCGWGLILVHVSHDNRHSRQLRYWSLESLFEFVRI